MNLELFNKKLPFLIIVFITLNNFEAASHDYYFGKLTIDHPYIIEPLHSSNVASGYMKITNRGNNKEILLGAKTSFSKSTEFHYMKIENNIMKMMKLENGIEIPPKGILILQPKSFHIMFLGLQKHLIKGEKEKVLLNFKKTGEIIVNFDIESIDKNNLHNHN